MDATVFEAASGTAPANIAAFISFFIFAFMFVVAILGFLSGTFTAVLTGSVVRLGIILVLIFMFIGVITAIMA